MNWMLFGIMMILVVDIQKINAARSDNVADTRKKCVHEALMAAKVEEMCLREGTDKQSALDYKSFNGKKYYFYV